MWSSVLTALLALAQPVAAAPEFDEAFVQQVYDRVAPAIGVLNFTSEVTKAGSGEIEKRDGTALGLVVSPGGLVMTHGHMQIDNTRPVSISFSVGTGEQEKKYPATLLRKPDDVNVCFLQLQSDTPLHLPFVQFAAGRKLALGEPVLLFGVFSQSLDYTPGLAVRRIGAILEKPRLTYCLDEPLRFGFVSAPVLNTRGEAVGVAGFDLSASEGGDLYVRSGHPLVYQADLFKDYIEHPLGESDVRQQADDSWIGVFTQPLSDDFAEYWGLDKDGGVVINTVVPGSPAEVAGCKPGDVVVMFNGVATRPKQDRELSQFSKLVRETGIGKTVSLKLLRAGQPMDIEVTLGQRPTPSREAAEYHDEVLGLDIRELTTDVRIALNLPESAQGVIVRRIKQGSFAHLAGMRPGIIIMNLADFPTNSIDEYKEAVRKIAEQKPTEISAFCRAGAATGFFRIEPRWTPPEQPPAR